MPASSQLVGQTISHYRILRKLGGGGMGVVYMRLRTSGCTRHVALKFLPEAMVKDQKALQRFERESPRRICLESPNICTIYEVEEHNQLPVIVMEVLEGETLKEKIRKGPIPTNEVLEFGIQASEALDAAHAKGIIHRDIKPGNIFIVGREASKDSGFPTGQSHRAPFSGRRIRRRIAHGRGCLFPAQLGTCLRSRFEEEEVDTRSDLFSFA